MSRTDTHRPAAIEPADYFEIGWLYCGPDSYLMRAFRADRERVERVMSENGYRWSRHEHGGTCGICGALAFTLGVFVHRPTGETIKAGEDCARKMELQAGSLFRVAKTKLAAERKAKAGKLKARATLDRLGIGSAWAWRTGEDTRLADLDRELGRPQLVYPPEPAGRDEMSVEEWRRVSSEHYAAVREAESRYYGDERAWKARMREAIGPAWASLDRACHILSDMIDKLIRYGKWSEGQEELAVKLWSEIDAFPSKLAEYKAAAAEAQAEREAIRLDAGRQTVEGEVLTVKEQESDYGTQVKLLVKRDDGAKLWGTCPAALLNVAKGDRVRFAATVQPKEPGFAFYSRPAKPELISATA